MKTVFESKLVNHN